MRVDRLLAMLEDICELVEPTIVETGDIFPVVYFVTREGQRGHFLVYGENKEEASELCQAVFRAYEVRRFVFASSLWTLAASPEGYTPLPPSKSERRQESVVVSANDGENTADLFAPILRCFETGATALGPWETLYAVGYQWWHTLLPVPPADLNEQAALRTRLRDLTDVQLGLFLG